MSEFKLDAGAIAPELPVQPTAVAGDLFANLRKEEKEVVCLGLAFPNDAARRAHFTALLAEKLKDPEFRKIEGFPIGKDEDILALSDPPYYCACPNPWLGDFIKEWEAAKPKRKGKYEREPFAADVSEGKNDPIYNAHSYHTKVPHKAIMRYILHYTEPGDIVFDGFCGTGMTGVAAQMCGDRKTVESLGYKVDDKGNITDPKAEDPKKVFSHLGARKAVLNDLSPAATFIAYNYNTPVDVVAFEQEAKRILAEVEKECGWMYETQHVDKDGKLVIGMDGKPVMGRINYTVWSDVYLCPHCGKEVVFWNAAVDKEAGKVKDEFNCPHCVATMTKRNSQRAFVTNWDNALQTTVKMAKQMPVLINYTVGKKRHVKTPDEFDLELISRIDNTPNPYPFPITVLPRGKETDRNKPIGITYVHQFYTKRNLWLLALFKKSLKKELQINWFWVEAATRYLSKLSKICMNYFFHGGGGAVNAGLLGTLYVPSTSVESNVIEVLGTRLGKLISLLPVANYRGQSLLMCQSSTEVMGLASESFDYLFLDPPFGANLNYSELNCIWESWLGVMTDCKPEAVENDVQHKGIDEYRSLMKACFAEAYRVLKPGHWLTVEFSNTSASVWNSIQTTLSDVGFVVANVSSLDKKQGSFKAVTTPTAVKQDLVISAYKPDADFEKRFKDEAVTEDGVWDFIRTHLEKLPVSKMKAGVLQVLPERDPRILFDKVVAYYFRNGFPIPISAKEFQEGLRTRFTEDDGMFFLPEQHAEYLKQKAKATQLVQAELFVSDESSAIAWLRQKLKEKPQKMQTIQPEFMQQIQAWNKYEQELELRVLLEQNFLCYDGRGPVPNPIHTYLSTQYHELRNLKDEDPALKAKAKDLWYVPNPKDAAEVEKMRERALLKEYEAYKTEKKIKTPRFEALRLGFQKSYEAHDYATIVAIAKKIPSDVVETDEKLLRYFDRAQLHLED